MTEETTQTNEQPNLSIADIVILKQVVEIATARGAFKAEELTTVGTVYDRVGLWLASVMPTEESTEDKQTESVDADIDNQEGEANA